MNWNREVSKLLNDRGLKFIDYESWYVFVEDSEGRIFPIRESVISKWIEGCSK